MGHQGAPNVNFHHYTVKNSELAKNWPSSGPRLSRISTFTLINLAQLGQFHYILRFTDPDKGFSGSSERKK